MPNLYKNIPDCSSPGCDEAGVYFMIPGGQSLCPKHARGEPMNVTDALAWLKGLEEGAKKAPWSNPFANGDNFINSPDGGVVDVTYYDGPVLCIHEPDATLIAVTRNVLPELLACVDALERLFGASKNELAARNLPIEWSEASAMAQTHAALTALAAAVAREKGDK